MAETNFQPKSNIQVGIGNGSANLGTAHANSDTWNFVQVTDFTFDQASAPVEVAPSKNSVLGQLESQGHHRRDNIMYEASLTMRGTPTAVLKSCLALFGSGTSEASLTPAANTNNGSGGQMLHGAANTNAVTLLFENAGSDATSIDVSMKGCFATSMTMRQDVATNGGEMVVETNFVTAYLPTESAFAAPSSKTLDTGAPKNIFGTTTSTLDSEVLMLNSWEITISRPLVRIGSQDYSSFLPFGYAQTGPYEVTGQLLAKRDDSVFDFASHAAGDSTGIALALASSGFAIAAPDVMIDNTKPDMGGDYLLQTIPFRAFAASETAQIIGITIS